MIAPEDWALVSGLGLVLLAVIGGIGTYRHERRMWNGGCCGECGETWRYFTTDSHQSLGFKCSCGRCCWISYRSAMRA